MQSTYAAVDEKKLKTDLLFLLALKRKQVGWAGYSRRPSCGAAWIERSMISINSEANET